MNLLVDVDDVPQLDLVVVDGGTIIFPCDHNDDAHLSKAKATRTTKTFAASYIFVTRGSIEIGTEDDPYECQLEITLHGAKADPQAPLFGSKGIFVREGTLDMHGKVDGKTWTTLSASTTTGSPKTLTLAPTVLDWEVEDEIIITTTDLTYRDPELLSPDLCVRSPDSATEKHVIETISSYVDASTDITITLVDDLTTLHYGDSAASEFMRPD